MSIFLVFSFPRYEEEGGLEDACGLFDRLEDVQFPKYHDRQQALNVVTGSAWSRSREIIHPSGWTPWAPLHRTRNGLTFPLPLQPLTHGAP